MGNNKRTFDTCFSQRSVRVDSDARADLSKIAVARKKIRAHPELPDILTYGFGRTIHVDDAKKNQWEARFSQLAEQGYLKIIDRAYVITDKGYDCLGVPEDSDRLSKRQKARARINLRRDKVLTGIILGTIQRKSGSSYIGK